MNLIKAIIFLGCLTLFCGCSTQPVTRTRSLPSSIKTVTDATAAYDGGSILICFTLQDGSDWRLWMNKSISDENNPDVYKAIFLKQVTDASGVKLLSKIKMITKGSKEEYDVLTLLYEYRKTYRKADKKLIYWIDLLLKDKKYRPTSAWTLRGKTHNFHA